MGLPGYFTASTPIYGSKKETRDVRVQKEQPPDTNSMISFSYVVDGFLLDRRAQGVSKKTLSNYHQELGYFQKFLDEQGISTIEGVTAPVARYYLSELATHRNSGGCHLAYRVLKSLTCWWEAELDGDYTSPLRRVKPPKRNNELLPPADPFVEIYIHQALMV
jgi:site-specific recombinase XerC